MIAKRLPLLLLPVFALTSCDSLKEKLVAFLDERIEEPGSSTGHQSIRDLTISDYDSFIKTEGYVVVLAFKGKNCGTCRQLEPVLESVVKSNDKVILGKLDVDKYNSLAARERVEGIPDVRIYVDGIKVDGFVGAPPADVVRERILSQIPNIKTQPADELVTDPEPAKPEPQPEPVKPLPLQPKPPTQVQQPAPAPSPAPDKPEKPERPERPEKEPAIKPMDKDWLPPGVQRK